MKRISKPKPYLCHWTNDPIRIGGKLDETAWNHATRTERFLIAGRKKPARFPTLARLLWSDTHLYFSAEMEDADIYGSSEGHDSPFGGDDVIELFVKPGRQQPSYWEFHITPRGATRDYFWARRGAGPAERWIAFESGMQAAVTLDGTLNHWEDFDRGWTAEMSVPWSAFEKTGGKPAVDDRWMFLVSRYDYSVHQENGLELSASCYLPREDFHCHERYGEVVFVK